MFKRVTKKSRFTQLSNAVILNSDLSLKAKGLLAVLMSRSEDWAFYMEWVEKQSKDGRESHQTAMKELTDQRYVVKVRNRLPDGTFKGWVWLVDDEPIEAGIEDEPKSGKPVSRENRKSGKPKVGKPAAINTDLTKTDLTKTENPSGATAPGDLASDSQPDVQGGRASAAEPAEVPGVQAPVGAAPGGASGRTLSQVTEQQSPAPVKNDATVTEQVPGAAAGAASEENLYKAMYAELWRAVEDVRAKGKESAVGAKAKDALQLGFTPAEARAAITWAMNDPWWSAKITPGRLTELLTAWDAERKRALPGRAPTRPAEIVPAPAEPGKPRRIF